MTESHDPADLEATAAQLAAEAAQVLRHEVDRPHQLTNKSSATDWVTEVDAAVEQLLVSRIATLRPTDGVLGEEGASVSGTSGVRWVLDPIDGTTNFLYGHPGFSVSIAAEVHGTVLAGAVADPLMDHVYRAHRGGGAWRNNEPIHVRAADRMESALIATGFSYDRAARAEQAAIVATLLQRAGDIRRMGSAAMDLCAVASGRVAGYYERGLSYWDYAAGALIASEAGATVSVADDDAAGPVLVVAAIPSLFDELRTIVDGG